MNLNDLRQYHVAPLMSLGEDGVRQATLWFGHYDTANAHAQSLTWRGDAYEAMAEKMWRDNSVAANQAGTAMTAGQYATFAAGDLAALHANAMGLLEMVTANGYHAGDGDGKIKVTDITPPLTVQEQQARREYGDFLEERLNSAVTTLAGHDQDVARVLQGHQEDLETSRFADGVPIHGGAVPVDNHTTPDPPGPAVKYTPQPHPPVVINEHGGKTPVAADSRDHNGSARDIVDGFGKVAIGIGTEAGGVLAGPATGGASLVGTIPGGALPIYDGLDDLSHLTNLGRLPDAPPIIGQDGPG